MVETNYAKGLKAERIAALYLRLKGYRILARRYKTKYGEIDIIAAKRKVLLIVEVKYRKEIDLAIASITRRTARRIFGATKHWLYRNRAYSNFYVRFDVIILGASYFPIHIKDYFVLK